MEKLVKQIYLKMLIRPKPNAWQHLPSQGDAISLLECLIDRTKPIPSIWWIDPRHATRK